jgi:hypothetical protein
LLTIKPRLNWVQIRFQFNIDKVDDDAMKKYFLAEKARAEIVHQINQMLSR